MRIGIITLPVQTSNNYGGVIQNYALQQVLKKLGHTPVTIQFTNIIPQKCDLNFWQRLCFRRASKCAPSETVLTPFCRQHITLSKPYHLPLHMEDLVNEHFDAYISGSDQIWHPNLAYKYFILASMLNFTRNSDVKRIAYAASFGRFQTSWSKCRFMCSLKKFAKCFDFIGVREIEGIQLCKKYFNYDNAVNVLDPTLLISSEDYDKIVKLPANNQALVTYILDDSQDIKDAIDSIFSPGIFAEKYELSTHNTNGKSHPDLETWLGTLKSAKLIITDSFHGTVFAIIFRRPFITIANNGRGLSRFTSLLSQCGLSSRLVKSPNEITPELCHEAIDFDRAHDVLRLMREKSLKYLQDALNSDR